MNANSELLDYARASIEIAARKLLGKCGITHGDLEDIESEMMLDVLQRLPKHDAQRWSAKTFIPHVVRNKANDILRQRSSGKSQALQQIQSLDTPLRKERHDVSQTLYDVAAAELAKESDARTACEHADLCHDIEAIIQRLSKIQKQCCRAILKGKPISHIAQEHSIPRTTFYERVVEPIRQAFRRANMDAHLK